MSVLLGVISQLITQRLRDAATVTPLDASLHNPLEGAPSFPYINRLERLLWRVVWLFFARWTPPFFNPWRVVLLKAFGAILAPGAAVASSARIWLPRNLMMGERSTLGPGVDCYNMAPIRIGRRVTVSQRAVLCAGSHDIASPNFQLTTAPIVIGDDCWVAAEAFVGPGVTMGAGAVAGARGCVFGQLEEWSVYVGNPARRIKARIYAPGQSGVSS